ncbi:GFA family protein [Rhodobacterales bacterium HKCCE3408]|nr:GFA family protein [Rhodobacterales bacterium HKCCE3408]
MIEGACLCGAVTVRLSAPLPGRASACHCRLCRVWTGAAQWGVEVPEAAVTVTGAVKTYRSTPFAERAFCPDCGTHLWLRDDDGPYEFVPGLFDAARDVVLDHEVYADRAFACVTLAGDHPRISAAEYERTHKHLEGCA